MLIDFKYNTRSPNLFTYRESGVSNFWRGVLWVAEVAKIGYRCKLATGNRIKF
jgi:hypothetical protein